MVEATHENFATLTVCSMERWLLSSEKSYACVDTTFTMTYGKLLLEKRWFACGLCGLCDNALIICGGKIFMGLILWLRRPTKILMKTSAYTVCVHAINISHICLNNDPFYQ